MTVVWSRPLCSILLPLHEQRSTATVEPPQVHTNDPVASTGTPYIMHHRTSDCKAVLVAAFALFFCEYLLHEKNLLIDEMSHERIR